MKRHDRLIKLLDKTFFFALLFFIGGPRPVAAAGLVPCTNDCGFDDVITLLNNIITFIITDLMLPVFVVIVFYCGFIYLTAEGNPAKVKQVKSILKHAVFGLVIMLCSWLIVRTILYSLGYTEGLLFLE